MNDDLEHNIQRLFRIRALIRVVLTSTTIVFFVFFLGGMTLYRDLFALSLSNDSSLTLGIVCAVALIFIFVLLELLYILACRYWLDPLQQKIEKTRQTETLSND